MSIDSPEALGRTLAAVRRRQGLRQDDVALTAGTGLRFLHDLENGKPTVQLGKVLRAIEALGLVVELRDRAGNRVAPEPASAGRRRVSRKEPAGGRGA